jgi:hypothetical protein
MVVGYFVSVTAAVPITVAPVSARQQAFLTAIKA